MPVARGSCSDDVQAALGLAAARPAPGARVLAVAGGGKTECGLHVA